MEEAVQPPTSSAWYLAPQPGQPNMAVVIGWRQAQHIGAGVAAEPFRVVVATDGAGVAVATGIGVVTAAGACLGITVGSGATICPAFGSLRPRSAPTPRVAKATSKTATSRATARVESKPLSPDVPMGSPDEVAAKLKLESLAVLCAKFTTMEAEPGISARMFKRTRTDCPTSRSRISFPSTEATHFEGASTKT